MQMLTVKAKPKPKYLLKYDFVSVLISVGWKKKLICNWLIRNWIEIPFIFWHKSQILSFQLWYLFANKKLHRAQYSFDILSVSKWFWFLQLRFECVVDVFSLFIRSEIAYRLWTICSKLVADVYFRAKIGCICLKQRTQNIKISIKSQTFHTFKFNFVWVCIVCDFCRYLDGSRSFLSLTYLIDW